MKSTFKPIAYALSTIISLITLFSFDITAPPSSHEKQTPNTLDTLALLQARKWVHYWNKDTISAILQFDGNKVTSIDYEDGDCTDKDARHGNMNFYLSDTPDIVFNRTKLGNKNGKYIILQIQPYPDTNDDTDVLKILFISLDSLKLKWQPMHGEAIAGPGGPVTCIGEAKTN